MVFGENIFPISHVNKFSIVPFHFAIMSLILILNITQHTIQAYTVQI